MWRPLPLLSFWVEGRLGGWEPTLFHAVSILLHAGCALLVGRLLTGAGLPWLPAALGAVGFATLPAHVEPVAWISGRTDLLCGFFALLALHLDRRAREAGRAWPGWGAPLALAAALLSKEAAAGWVAVIAAAEWVRNGGAPARARETARWIAPYVAVTVVWLVAHAAAAGPTMLPAHVDEALRARRQAAGWTLLPQYLVFLWPWFPHASDVAVTLPARPWGVPVVAGAAFTVASFAAAVWLAVRRARIAVPAAAALVPVAPAIAVALGSGFVSSGERMIFLASAGIAGLAAAGLAWCVRRGGAAPRIACGASLIVIFGGAIETARLQPLWRDDETVFRAVTERHPRDPVGWVGLAEALGGRGDRAGAEAALRRAASIDPRLPAIPLSRAELHYRAGEWEAVLEQAAQAIALDPGAYRARLLRASTRVRVGRADEAAEDVAWMLARRPGDPSALMVSAQVHLALGRPDLAIGPLETATGRTPGDPAAWAALGHARAAAGALPAARTALEQALRIEPRAPQVWRRLAAVCAALGDSAAAAAALERGRAAADPAPAPAGP